VPSQLESARVWRHLRRMSFGRNVRPTGHSAAMPARFMRFVGGRTSLRVGRVVPKPGSSFPFVGGATFPKEGKIVACV